MSGKMLHDNAFRQVSARFGPQGKKFGIRTERNSQCVAAYGWGPGGTFPPLGLGPWNQSFAQVSGYFVPHQAIRSICSPPPASRFVQLQRKHAVRQFNGSCVPPFANGMTWSMVGDCGCGARCVGSVFLRHRWQR